LQPTSLSHEYCVGCVVFYEPVSPITISNWLCFKKRLSKLVDWQLCSLLLDALWSRTWRRQVVVANNLVVLSRDLLHWPRATCLHRD
jgi:hypothetical protein